MPYRSKRVFLGDYIFLVDENVYEPAEDSFFFAKNLNVNEGESVLDMGTGCGLLGILAAGRGACVTAVDVNPYALRCTGKNAEFNCVGSKIDLLQSDLFAAFRQTEKFDVILFNAPYLPTEKLGDNSWIERAWSGGTMGRQVINRFISHSTKHLKHQGRILLLQSTLSNVNETLSAFTDHGMQTKIVSEQELPFFEKIVLIQITFIL